MGDVGDLISIEFEINDGLVISTSSPPEVHLCVKPCARHIEEYRKRMDW